MSDNIVLYLLIALVVALLVLRTYVRRRSAQWGANRWQSRQDGKAGPEGLGLALLLGVDVATATPIVDRVLSTGKRVRRLDPQTWGQEHYKTDDVVYHVRPVQGGTLVQVTRAVETGGDLSGVKVWHQMRDTIATDAAAAGIAATPTPAPLVPVGDVDGSRAWAPAAG